MKYDHIKSKTYMNDFTTFLYMITECRGIIIGYMMYDGIVEAASKT